MNEIVNWYFSQYGQDKALAEVIFRNKTHGVFLDIGANDGVTYSNTYFFEKELKWNGVCIEPLPHTFEKLKQNRDCIVENCAVGAKNSKEIFLEISGYAEMLSGLKSKYDKRHLDRIDSEIKLYGGTKKEVELNVVNINQLIMKHSIDLIDYCNIDTEGSELYILKAVNFNKIKINVLTVEANYKIDRIKLKFYLFLRGYRYVCNFGNDMLFIHLRLLNELGDISILKHLISKAIL
ncbi:MAG: FkbM family methyltransferase [Bacteroidetes bacterium]|nr:FkbM family methyltransferase [Bacteroidota bacterium]MBS1539741.1 FkbM family methyltransferase [Bacteroidota bacterium]